MKRTLRRESKAPEIVGREAFEVSGSPRDPPGGGRTGGRREDERALRGPPPPVRPPGRPLRRGSRGGPAPARPAGGRPRGRRGGLGASAPRPADAPRGPRRRSGRGRSPHGPAPPSGGEADPSPTGGSTTGVGNRRPPSPPGPGAGRPQRGRRRRRNGPDRPVLKHGPRSPTRARALRWSKPEDAERKRRGAAPRGRARGGKTPPPGGVGTIGRSGSLQKDSSRSALVGTRKIANYGRPG